MSSELERIMEQERKRSPETFYENVAHGLYAREFLDAGVMSVIDTDWRDALPPLDAAARHPVLFNQTTRPEGADKEIEDFLKEGRVDEQLIDCLKARNSSWVRSAILALRKDYREIDDISQEDYEKRLMILSEIGYSSNARYHSIPITQGHSGESFITEKTVHVPDIARSSHYYQIPGDEFLKGSEVAIPIINRTASGVLVVTSPEVDAFTTQDIALLEEYSERVGTVIEKISDINLDELTGFWTRGRFENDYRRMFLRAKNTYFDGDDDTSRGFGLVTIDGNALKYANDHNDGHSSGDSYLSAIAQAIRQTIRSSDEAYRIGGDEFAILLDSNKSEIDLGRFIEGRLKPTIRETVKRLHEQTGINVPYKDPVSVGGASIQEFFAQGIQPTTSLLRQKADAGTYADKNKFRAEYPEFVTNGR